MQTLIVNCVKLNMKIHHMDVTCAFLNGELEEVYMSQPEAYVSISQENLICR